MGVYWRLVCPEANSMLDPGSFEENYKHTPYCPDTLKHLAFLMQEGSWLGKPVFLVSDSGDMYDGPPMPGCSRLDRQWRDASQEAIALNRADSGCSHCGSPGWGDCG